MDKKTRRVLRHRRLRKKIYGTQKRPRLSIFKSNRNLYAQIIDDDRRATIASVSSREFSESRRATSRAKSDAKKEKPQGKTKKSDAAVRIGELIAERALKKGIHEVVFDRGGFAFHGRIKHVAESARKAGLKF